MLTVTVKSQSEGKVAKVRTSTGEKIFLQDGEEAVIAIHDDKSFQVNEASAEEFAEYTSALESATRLAAEESAAADAALAGEKQDESSDPEGEKKSDDSDAEGETQSEDEAAAA